MPEWWEGTFEERMARRAARRAAEIPEWLRDTPEEARARRLASLKRHHKALGARIAKPPKKKKRTRPSDGQESGAPFNYDEYLTRKEDQKAADPEEWQRQQRIKKEESRAFWERFKHQAAMDAANKEIFGSPVTRLERLRDIWWGVIKKDEEIEMWHQLPQAVRIEATRKHRIKGCGAAAKRAGFAG